MGEFKKDNNLMSGKGEWSESDHPRDDDGKFISVNEFRYMKEHPKEGIEPHPTHLYARNGNKVKYHQLTHSKKIKDLDIENIKMFQNPNPNDKRQAYFIPKSQQAEIEEFDKKKKKWFLSKKDNTVMKKFRDSPFDE